MLAIDTESEPVTRYNGLVDVLDVTALMRYT